MQRFYRAAAPAAQCLRRARFALILVRQPCAPHIASLTELLTSGAITAEAIPRAPKRQQLPLWEFETGPRRHRLRRIIYAAVNAKMFDLLMTIGQPNSMTPCMSWRTVGGDDANGPILAERGNGAPRT